MTAQGQGDPGDVRVAKSLMMMFEDSPAFDIKVSVATVKLQFTN